MRISRISLQNIKSFRYSTEIVFNPNINIFIGPNGGGKSNLMNTLSWVLNSHFYRPFAFHMENDRAVLQLHNYADNTPEPHWSAPDEPSFVWIEFEATAEDIEGMRTYWRNKDSLTQTFEDFVLWEKSSSFDKSAILLDFERGLVDPDAHDLAPGKLLRYRITITRDPKRRAEITPVDSQDCQIIDDGAQLYDAYLRYLTDAELRRTLQKTAALTLPYVLYSPIREPHDLNINMSGTNIYDVTRTYHQEMQNFVFNNKGSSQVLTQISSIMLGAEFVQLIYEYGMTRALSDFSTSKSYTSLSNDLSPFGFQWKMCIDNQWANQFCVKISRIGEESYFSVDQASSGERQLINFIFGLSSSTIENSLVIVDEPELNLHPRWQKLLLRFFLKTQRSKGAQFIISTHSSSFLTEHSLPHVRRIYRKDKSSALSKAHDSDAARSIYADSLRFLNAHQNERIFFTQKAVLVEGASDFVIWQKLLGTLLDIFNVGDIVEVVEVNGSDNFIRYKNILDLFEIESYIVADLDYAGTVGDSDVKNIFSRYFSERKASKGLLSAHSVDRNRLIASLERYLEDGDQTAVKSMLDYIKSRTRSIDVKRFSETDRTLVLGFADRLRADGVFILKRGALESYYVESRHRADVAIKDSDRAVAFASDASAFKQWLLKGARQLAGERLTVKDQVLAAEASEFLGIGLEIIGLTADAAAGRQVRDAMAS